MSLQKTVENWSNKFRFNWLNVNLVNCLNSLIDCFWYDSFHNYTIIMLHGENRIQLFNYSWNSDNQKSAYQMWFVCRRKIRPLNVLAMIGFCDGHDWFLLIAFKIIIFSCFMYLKSRNIHWRDMLFFREKQSLICIEQKWNLLIYFNWSFVGILLSYHFTWVYLLNFNLITKKRINDAVCLNV